MEMQGAMTIFAVNLKRIIKLMNENKNFIRKRQAIYISPNKKSTRIIKTLMNFFFFIKVKIKMVCFSVPSHFVDRGSIMYNAEILRR